MAKKGRRGRRIRSTSDPSLAKMHAAGATVTLVQPTLHKTYGVVYMHGMRYWPLHARVWRQNHDGLVEADRRLLKLPLKESNDRQADLELSEAIYVAGVEVVIHSI